MSKEKKYTYHKSYSFVSEGQVTKAVTQQYKVGVYMIINDDPSLQMSVTPSKMVQLEKDLRELEEKGKIQSLKFGIPITVTEIDGLWEEVINDDTV